MSLTLLVILFFVIAIIYSSVGFGGGSSYLALLLLMELAPGQIKPIALVCNIIVVSISLINYQRFNLVQYKKILPLVMLSIPMAFFGGMISLDTYTYKILAGSLLVLAGAFMLVRVKANYKKRTISNISLCSIGGGIGLLSGMIGIGGGIFLAPLLHLSRWQSARIIAATSSLFILANSLSGLIGHIIHGMSIDGRLMAVLGASVFFGGLIGNTLSIKVLSQYKIKMLTAILILFVGARLIFAHIF